MADVLTPTLKRRSLRTVFAELHPSVVTGGAPIMPLLVLFGLNAADELDRVAFAVLLPEIRDWYGIDLATALTLTSVALTLTIALAIPIGFLSDRLRRTRLVAAGAATWGLFSFLTGLAPNLITLTGFRFGSGAGKVMDPAHNSLLADYYPPHVRPGVYSFHQAANALGRFAGPLIAGGLAALFFWQVPFFIFAIPGLALAWVAVTKLREPARGEQERRAQGASEEIALAEDAPPNWTESWRIAWNVRTLRRIWYSLPFLVGSYLAFVPLLSLYFEDVFDLGPALRGVIAGFEELFTLAGIITGGVIGNRLIRYRPGRVITYVGLAAFVAGFNFVLIAVAPILLVAIVFSYAASFLISVFLPATNAVMSIVTPPRARAFALAVGALFIVPGALAGPLAGVIADEFGVRAGILVLVPVFLAGAAIIASAGASVDADMRQAAAAAMAAHVSRQARDEGRARLLVCRDVDVHYDGVRVLFNVDFEVEEGSILALLGTNGAGKSTLLRAIAGLTPPSNGAIFFDGEDITYLPANDHAARGIVEVPGGRGIFPTLSVRENLRLAAWLYRDDESYVAEATGRVLGYFPVLGERMDAAAGDLSGGEQQMLALAQAFMSRPRLLLVDELSLGLSPAIVSQLLEIVKAIAEQGTTIVLVEQSVNVALTLAKRAVFMEKGEVRFSGPTADLLRRPDILRAVFLRGASAIGGTIAAPRGRARRRSAATDQAPVLEVRGVSKRYGGVDALVGVSLPFEEGKLVGLIGPNGAGKTTLFDVISGFVAADEGRVLVAGEDVTDLGPDERAKLGLQRSFQDARLFPALTVAENIAVALERQIEARDPVTAALRLPNVRRAEAKVARRAERLIELFGLGDFTNKFVRELSTGSRRIVDLACLVAADPKTLLLDEPSSGIAQSESEELGPLLLRVKQESGCSMLVIEHDMTLIRSIADELVAMDLGAVIARGLPDDVIDHPRVVESYLGTSEEAILGAR